MPGIELLATGEGEYPHHDPDTPGPGRARGLPAGTGPWHAVTLRALFGFDDATHERTLLDMLATPAPHELEILPELIDPGRAVIGRTAKS